MRLRLTSFLLSAFAVGALLCFTHTDARAQGHSGHAKHHVPPGQAKKHVVTTDQAIIVTRDVLTRHGYVVVRIVHDGDARVVYYRRGNRGRGRGRGPIERMIIRPSQDRVIFEATPKSLLIDINVRLGL